MDLDFLHVRCGRFDILVPPANVAGVEPLPESNPGSNVYRRARTAGLRLMLDARCLLGIAQRPAREPGVCINWRSDDLNCLLVVDSVTGLRAVSAGEALRLPRVPACFAELFDGLVHDVTGGLLFSLRPDIRLDFRAFASRRRFCNAFMAAIPVPLKELTS